VEETRLYELALKRGWPIPATMRTKVVKRLREVIDDAEASPRELIAASKALISADQTSLAAITTALNARQQTELASRVEELEQRIDEYERIDEPGSPA
jgi:hypothetical protein